jgi:hypothetical protein
LESEWNKTHPGNELRHIAHRKLYHFKNSKLLL